jgi:hypothetical protein
MSRQQADKCFSVCFCCVQVLLVGGFARSPYLEARVRQAVQPLQGAHLQVVVPQNPHIAVLSGEWVGGGKQGDPPCQVASPLRQTASAQQDGTRDDLLVPTNAPHQTRCNSSARPSPAFVLDLQVL